tara:strand:- start:24 stop:740 length:717 start_codon:yes stop_codon:yes gene_type:complete
MVSVDTVYQRVLALANKEQRGYITPQEFNLYANQAQMEIFEQYFYDIRLFNKIPGNNTEFSDPLYMLNEKKSIFEVEQGSSWTQVNLGSSMILPNEIYRIGTVRIGMNQVEILSSKDFDAARLSPLTSPTPTRPIAYIAEGKLSVATGANIYETAISANMNISYIRKPAKVSWGYVVFNEKALFDSDSNKTTNFELHSSEETELVYKILKLAGVSMKRDDIMRAGQGLEISQIQQEKQ